MSGVHAVLGVSVLGANLLAAGWGAVAWLRKEPSVWFWYLLRVAQAVVVVQIVLGFILFARGLRAPDGLHVVYGIAPLVVTFFSEGMRAGVAHAVLADVEGVDSLSPGDPRAVARRGVLRGVGGGTVGAPLSGPLCPRAVQ